MVLALLSSLVWGSSDFAAGLLSKRVAVLAVVGWSQAIGLIAISIVVAVQGLPSTALGAWAPWAFLAGVCGTIGLLAFYRALSTGTMGVVAPIAALGTAIPVLLGVLTGDQPGVFAWLGIVVAILGVALTSGPELQQGLSARPVLLAVLAAFGFGLTLFAIDRGSRVTLLHTLWGMRLTSCLGFAVLAVGTRSLGDDPRGSLPWLAGIGIADLGANALFGAASSMGMVSVTAVIGSLYPVVTVLLARRILAERLRSVQVVGVVVAMTGVVLIAGSGAG